MAKKSSEILEKTNRLNDAAWDAVPAAFIGGSAVMMGTIYILFTLFVLPERMRSLDTISVLCIGIIPIIFGMPSVIKWNRAVRAVKDWTVEMQEMHATLKDGKGNG